MANQVVRVLVSGAPKAVNSNQSTFDFLSVKIGTSGLEIKQTGLNFDFSGLKLTNIAAGTVSGDAVEYTQLNTALALYVPLTQKGASNGVATLDSGGKVPVSQLPNSVMEYLGTWDASTNTPTLANGTGNAGDVYICNVAGTTNFGAGPITFAVGDWAIYNGSIWQKSINSNAVVSVNGFTGVVSLTTTDIPQGTNLYYTASQARTDLITQTLTSGDTTHAPSSDAVISYVASQVGSGTTASLVNDNAGTITIRQVVYIKSNGNVDLARANAASTSLNGLGLVAAATIATTASGLVTVSPGTRITGFSGLTPGAAYFLSDATAGALTTTAPSATVGNVIRQVGYALSATEFVFLPQPGEEITA